MSKKLRSPFIFILSFLSYQTGFGQIEYPTEILTTRDMNLKGNVRKVTDSSNILTKKGKIDKDALSTKKIYLFNQDGQITGFVSYARLNDKQIMTDRIKYEYSGKKLMRKTAESSKGKKIYSYTYTNKGYYFTEEGTRDTTEVEISNGRIISENLIWYYSSYSNSSKDTRATSLTRYAYNQAGYLSNVTYSSLDFEKFVYNDKGYIIEYQGPKASKQDSYEYSDYINNNWTKCIASSTKFDDMMNMTTANFQIHRDITYYTNQENNNSAPTGKNVIDIEFDIRNYNGDKLLVCYNAGGETTYAKDTLTRQNGTFRYQKNEPVNDAIYKIAPLRGGNYFQVIIDKNNHHYKVQTDATDLEKNVVISNSAENVLFYDYMKYMNRYYKERDLVNSDKVKLREDALAYENKIIADNPASYIAFWLKSKQPVDNGNIPGADFLTDVKDIFLKNIDLSDDRLSHTSFFAERIDEYLDRHVYQNKDDQVEAVNFLMEKSKASKENYKTLLFHLLMKYQKVNYVCWDAIYVNVAEKFYCNNKNIIELNDVQASQLDNVCNYAKSLKPFLCGQKAPEIKMKPVSNGNQFTIGLQNVTADHKILVIWNLAELEKKDLFSELNSIYPKLKQKNAEIITVATGNNKQAEIEAYAARYKPQWVNTIDVEKQVSKTYNLQSPLSIFILDSKDLIVYKQIGVNQIEGLINKAK